MGKRPARRLLVCSSSPAPSTPPRSPPSTSRLLFTASPHVQDTDVASTFDDTASNDTLIPDNESVESCILSNDKREDDNDDEDEAGALGSELLADSSDALNTVTDADLAPQFGSMDSGDEAEKDDVEIGEYCSDEDVDVLPLPNDVVDEPDLTEQEISAEVLFAEDFLSRFGGEDEVLGGNLKSDVLREMGAT
ncbi:Hypothetical protein PHPALM_11013, partial [Phytophthora palmivora]